MEGKILLGLALYGAVSLLGDPRAAITQLFNQKEVITACLVLEAGGEGRAGMQAVMNVIQNRAKGDPAAYYSEVARPQQFACLNAASGFFFRDFTPIIEKARQRRTWKAASAVVAAAFDRKLADLTGGATYYYAHKSSKAPAWAREFNETVTIGGHKFFKDPLAQWRPVASASQRSAPARTALLAAAR